MIVYRLTVQPVTWKFQVGPQKVFNQCFATPESPPAIVFATLLRMQPPKWEVKFPKAWYDIDWWYYGNGRIQQLIENAYATGEETVVFDAVTHGEPTRYLINLRSWTQTNLTTRRIRQIRRR